MTSLLSILLPIFVIYHYNVTICNGQVFKKQILPIGICDMISLPYGVSVP